MKQHIGPNEPPPRGYGIAWRDAGGAVCLPLGLNLVAGVGRRVWLGVTIGVAPSFLEKWLIVQAKQADREGYDRAIQDTQRQLEARFGEKVSARLAAARMDEGGVTAAALGDAAAEATEHETWSDEERAFFQASTELARRKGDAIFFACQDPRCQAQPILARVEGDGGFWLACLHKRRWIPTPPGATASISRRGLGRLGLH